ncbi:MAG: hypothetical protein Q7T76_08305 [Ferruginibacter sp.]|nr:hypothetical protein [Ferruginibacter sp.]
MKFGDGFNVIASKDGCTSSPTRCPEDALVQRSDDAARSISAQITSSASTKVLAFPNPYSDHIKFNLKSDISGHGSLELYNMIGQKVKNVFQGYIEKGQVRTIDFSVPYSLRTNLVYVFRIGDQRTTGKIINLSK